ncbi:hypothetical protein [Streptosporangium longisporum]|uniref:DUF3806 domain-containing protein n=1 Tax=Streptosporangium longisporum TaxID=46187 RepID=A0ABP6LHB3_9ACTN
MGAEELSLIKENVDLAIEELGPLSDVDFGLNRESVEWVEGFIERQRSRPGFDPEGSRGLISVLGSFLGECIVAATGGRWDWSDDHGWGVVLPEGSTIFPFSKVEKQFRGGLEEGESVAGFYQVVVEVIATGKMRRLRRGGADDSEVPA